MSVYDKITNPMHEEMRQELLAVVKKYSDDGMPHMETWAVTCVVAGNVMATGPVLPLKDLLPAIMRNVFQGVRMVVR